MFLAVDGHANGDVDVTMGCQERSAASYVVESAVCQH